MNLGTDWRVGSLGGYLNFDGASAYVAEPTIGTSSLTSVTVSAWILAGTQVNDLGIIAYKYTAVEDKGFLLFVDQSTGKVRLDGRSGDGYQASGYSVTDVRNAWHHVTGMKTGTTWSIWVNGVMENSTSTSVVGEMNTTTDFRIGDGTGSDVGLEFTGGISDLTLHQRSMEPREILMRSKTPGIAYETISRRSYQAAAAPPANRYSLFNPSVLRASR